MVVGRVGCGVYLGYVRVSGDECVDADRDEPEEFQHTAVRARSRKRVVDVDRFVGMHDGELIEVNVWQFALDRFVRRRRFGRAGCGADYRWFVFWLDVLGEGRDIDAGVFEMGVWVY